MKRLFLSLVLLFPFFFFNLESANAATLSELQDALDNYGISYQANVYIDNPVIVDLGPLQTLLEENFSDIPLEYSWSIDGNDTQDGPKLETSFSTPGEKTIQLSIYALENDEKTLVNETDLRIFIYETTLPLITSKKVSSKDVSDFVAAGQEQGVYVKILGNYGEQELDGSTILKELESYTISYPQRSDYTTVWGEKEFVFSTLNSLSAIEQTKGREFPLNFVFISSYNPEVMTKYIQNNMSGKKFVDQAFILDEALKFQILKYPESIETLRRNLSDNDYSYTPITTTREIPKYLFISRFVNILGNEGMKTSDIYIILLLPIFLTIVAFTRHIIGFGSVGNMIPIFLGILCIKLGVGFTLGIFFLILIFNIFLGKIINNQTLLYAPKVALLATLNLFLFMILYQVGHAYGVSIPVQSVIYIIIFFIVAEKLISVVTTKEFREYEKSLYGTIFIALICYGLYEVNPLRVFLMSYPEMLMLLVPLNYYIGRFTGLRVTEYFRFRDILNTVEE